MYNIPKITNRYTVTVLYMKVQKQLNINFETVSTARATQDRVSEGEYTFTFQHMSN